ncbi:unnamed protein product [Lymnaea stagnalis]|uniref:Large ribosomal subunit protein bL17m n=1 Tax=Lymnaea stagnalis TaxID=6523 RepID=A0AAV2HCC9_LYMST
MLRFRHQMQPRKLKVTPGANPQARINKLREIVTGLIRYERVEPLWYFADEARQYAERLLYLAIKNGDKHKETMELADYWLEEKDLVHKLFKVLVPRYKNYKTCYTDLHKLAVEYPGSGIPMGVLELRGNPWPPIIARQRDTKFILSNMLLTAAKQDFYNTKQQLKSDAATKRQQLIEKSDDMHTIRRTDDSSSVDPPAKTENLMMDR